MREQLPAFFPPWSQRRTTSIGFNRNEFEISGATFQLSRKWGLCKSAEKCRDHRAEKKGNGSQSSSVEDMKEGVDMDGEEAKPAVVAMEEGADRGREIVENAGSPAREALLVLQWGHSKRPRCSRTENTSHHHHHHPHPHHQVQKKGSVTDESSHVLMSKRCKASAEKQQSPARAKMNGNGNGSRMVTIVKGEVEEDAEEEGNGYGDGDGGRKRARAQRANAGQSKNERSKTTVIASSPSPSPSPSRSRSPAFAQQVQVLNQSLRVELPKVIICLSRKEKEDDFLNMRGTKLPHRPKRRPKAVEKFLHYCSPGTWLAELSHGRYDVREKKCLKKKPRGLKAMESSESDSE